MHESPDQNISDALQEIVPAGRKVVLRKLAVQDGAESDIATGEEFGGTLKKPIILGEPIYVEEGNTSAVKSKYEKDGHTYIETQTSTYELVLEPEEFTGLHMESEFGTITFPEDAHIAELGGGEFTKRFINPETGEEMLVYINKDALQGVLLESHGGEIFAAMGSRFFVLARVGNIHLPFYISSNGTDGKRKGDWYPCFGFTKEWLIKGGHIDVASGDMIYHPEITRVQDILNNNLKLPTQMRRDRGELSLKKDGVWETVFLLGEHLKHQSSKKSEFPGRASERDLAFVQRVTGYSPSSEITSHRDGHGTEWIESIVSQIKPTT